MITTLDPYIKNEKKDNNRTPEDNNKMNYEQLNNYFKTLSKKWTF